MIQRRPHTLKAVVTTPKKPYQDDDGNMVFPDGGSDINVERSCRGESNTADGRTVVRDGVNYEYSYLVFTDTAVPVLPNNAKVTIIVNSDGSVFGEGVVVKFEKGQRVTRIWLK